MPLPWGCLSSQAELEKRLDELSASRAEAAASAAEADRVSRLLASREQGAAAHERSLADAYTGERQRLEREHDVVGGGR